MAPTWKYSKVTVEGNTLYKITTPELIDRLTNEVCGYWKIPEYEDKQRFPGAQPVSIEKKNFKQIKTLSYVVCAKLDGERFLLLATKVPEDLSNNESKKLNVSFLVSRNLDFYIITCCWSNQMYEGGILLDGELVGKNFTVHDTINVGGNIVSNRTWDVRWRTVDKLIHTNDVTSDKNTLNIRLKKFFVAKNLKDLFKEIDDLTIPSDGVVFYPMKDPIHYRAQPNLFKWKPPGNHTIDFKVDIQGDRVKLLTWGNKKTIEFDEVPLSKFGCIDDLKTGDIIEFSTVANEGKIGFQPILRRDDKPVGNNLYTVRKTLLNVKENITKENLIDALRV